MKPVMYIIANRGLKMSPGKLAAQVAHAAVEAFQVSDPEMIKAWYIGRHHTKIVLGAESDEAMHNAYAYLTDRGFDAVAIIDEGRTEIPEFSFTAIGVAIVDKDDPHTAATFESFRTYKPLPAKRKKRYQRVWEALTR
jgi:PTH2 family peptidyl-tRNA hydrolase